MMRASANRGGRDGADTGRPFDGVSVAALVFSFLVGPVGVALGFLGLSRTAGTGLRGRRLALTAIFIGAVQTIVVVAVAGSVMKGGDDPVGPAQPDVAGTEAADPAASPPRSSLSSSPSSPTSPDSEQTTAAGPTNTGASPSAPVGGLLVESVAGFRLVDAAVDEVTVAAGAQSAYVASYTNGREVLTVRASSWGGADDAAEQAELRAREDYAPNELIDSGDVGRPPVGHYLYYERDGRASLYWSNNALMIEVTGEPYWVQDFFVQYPS